MTSNTTGTSGDRGNTSDAPTLSDTRLIFVSPAPGRSGVGDYAQDFVDEVRPHFAEVIEYWIASDGDETLAGVIRDVRRIRKLAKEKAAEGPTVVHFEQSAGSLAPFWGSILPRSIPVTATVHDAPQPVWWPFKTRLLTRHRLLHHGAHYPLRPVVNALQRRVSDGRIVFTLTSIGARNYQSRQPGSDARASRIFVPPRPPMRPLTERPMAVGMFGHVYKGKGFDLVGRLRELLDDDIEIVLAGRGTAALPPVPGVRVLGEVNGPDEDAFFESIRFLIVPYSKDNRYGKAYAASSAVTRSFAYGTPIICILDGSLTETAAEGGALSVDGGIDAIAHKANLAVRDEETLRKLAEEVAHLQRERTLAHCVAPFLEAWGDITRCRT
ncbi:MAG: glycosyltransferase family 1 protein [Actinomycetota bacterium]|nr:glycosyltransferase family 1 protein [Actinomycetota bacterium]